MTTITAKIIEDSIAPNGKRLTTVQARYPRAFHAEVMTHRMFSRNASSSRAKPVERVIEEVQNDPAGPRSWNENKRGMQAGAPLPAEVQQHAQQMWLAARNHAVMTQEVLQDLKVHKQWANRVTEPWQHIDIILTGTEWENFFALRCTEFALPEFDELAWKIAQLYYEGPDPKSVEIGEWHLPYVTLQERDSYDIETLLKCSVARCARVSFSNHDGTDPDVEKDAALHDERLFPSKHMSPFEHQGTPWWPGNNHGVSNVEGNFRGWIQYRKTLKGETLNFDYWDVKKARQKKGSPS